MYTTARHTVASERYKRLFLGKRVALWLDTTDETVTWPAYPLETPKQSVGSVFLVAGELQAITVPVVSANVLGRRGYPTFCQESPLAPGLPVVLNECEFAEHFFGSNGTALAQGLGQKIDSSMNPVTTAGSSAVAWSIASDGSLRLQGAGYSVSMWRLGITEDVADAMIYIATSQDGADTLKLAGHTVVLDGNAPVAFAAADVVGKWKLGTFGDEHAPYAYNTNNGFSVDTFVRSADGTQSQDSYAGPLDDATDEFQTWHYRSGWKMVDSALYDTRYRANVPLSSMPVNTSYFSSCQAAFALGATQCAPIRVRNFRPLAKVGNRWYGIENLYTRALITNYTPPFQIDRFTRATYHELQP